MELCLEVVLNRTRLLANELNARRLDGLCQSRWFWVPRENAHTRERSNENELSDRRRERAWLRVKLF